MAILISPLKKSCLKALPERCEQEGFSQTAKPAREVIKIKALILCAGYASRLYPLTENTPKHLLEVGGKPILEHILEKVQSLREIREILIVTNARFHHQFQVWLNHYHSPKKIKLLNDGTISNETRLGAVGDINFVLKEEDVNEELLVIAGDNLFGFSLPDFLDFYREKQNSILALRDLKDVEKIKGKYGVAVLEESRVIQFQEKPSLPRSTLAATACYVFSRNDLKLVEQSIERGKADNPGDLVRYLVKESEVHGFVFDEPWFDIGSFESYEAAKKSYNTKIPYAKEK